MLSSSTSVLVELVFMRYVGFSLMVDTVVCFCDIDVKDLLIDSYLGSYSSFYYIVGYGGIYVLGPCG